MFQIIRICRMSQIRLLVSILVLGLGMAPDVQAKAQCRNKITQFGDVVAIDEALEQITLETLGRPATFQTNNTTKFKGKTLDSVADIQIGQRLEVNFCPVFQAGITGFAYKVAFTTLQFPPNQVVNLNVPPGTESVPVARVYAEDPKDKIPGLSDKHNVAFGDINGDGFDDMILAVFNRKTSATGTTFPGGVNIVYGGPNNVLGNSIEINTTGAISSLSETQILPTARTSLGRTVATGDFDGDGYDDVFLGGTTGRNTGAVYIIYGGKQLPGSVITLDERRADPAYTLIKTVLGALLASGDVNADGLTDILISDGGVLVIYGDTALRGVKIKPNATDDIIRATADTHISTVLGAGQTLASDDVNGDGYDDIVFGGTNRLYVVYGSATLPGTDVNLGPNLDLNGATLIQGAFSRGGFGGLTGELSTGDFNNDGFADLLFGTVGNGVRTGVGFVSSLGEVDIIYGSPSLPSSTIDLRFNPVGTYGETRIMGVELGTGFGTSITSADVNGDGSDDLILGAPGAGHPGITPKQSNGNDGALYVLFGKASLAGRQLIDPRAVADITVLADNPKDLLGWSTVAGGDINRDGKPEYATTALSGNNPSSSNPNQKEGYLVAIAGQSTTASAARTQNSIADDAPPADFGPVVRAVLDFDSGLSASTETVTLTRAAPTTLPSGVGAALPVQWSVSSDRNGYTTDLILIYTDDELGNADETGLTVYTSANGTPGSWSIAGSSQIRDALRNEIVVTGLNTTGIYTLVDPSGTPPATSSNLGITMAASPDPVGLGSQVVYTLTVTNNGPDIATGVTVTDTLAAGTTFVSASPAGCVSTGSTVACDLGVLASDAAANVAITVIADAVGSITNSASITANESDPDSANNTASVNTTIAGAVVPDLTASITKLKAKVKKGKTQLEFRVSVLNSGIGPSHATAFIEAYASTDTTLDIGNDTLIATWAVNPLIAGQSSNFKFKSKVPGDLSGQHLIIRIDATDAINEADESNNQLSRQIP